MSVVVYRIRRTIPLSAFRAILLYCKEIGYLLDAFPDPVSITIAIHPIHEYEIERIRERIIRLVGTGNILRHSIIKI